MSNERKRNDWHIEDIENLVTKIWDKGGGLHVAANLYEKCTGVFRSPGWIRGAGCTNPVKLFIKEKGEVPIMVLWLVRSVE